MRRAISPHKRLTVTLRLLATGMTYKDLEFSTVFSKQALSEVIPDTCEAIYATLKNDFMKMHADIEERKLQDDTLVFHKMGNWTEKKAQNQHLLVAYRELRLQCITALQNLDGQITVWWEECEKHPNLIREINKKSLEIQKLTEAMYVDKTVLVRYDHKAKALLREHIELTHKWRPEIESQQEPCSFDFSNHNNGLMTGMSDESSNEKKGEIGAMCTSLPQEYEDRLALYKDHIAQLHDMMNKIRRETLVERKKLNELYTAAVSRVGAADSKFCSLSQQLVSTYKNVYTKKMKWLEEEEGLLQTVSRLHSISQSGATEKPENIKLKHSEPDQEQSAKYYNELEAMLDGYKKKCQAIERTSQTTRREIERQQSALQEEIEKLKSVVKQLNKRLKELDVRRQEHVRYFHHNMNSLYKRLKAVKHGIHNNFMERPKEHILLDKEISAAAEVMLKNGQLLQMELEDLIEDVLRMQSSVDNVKI